MNSTQKQIEEATSLCREIVKELGEQFVNVEYLEAGSTSRVYRVSTDHTNYILRIGFPHSGKPVSYESDFYIRNTLHKAGLSVARPVATNRSFKLSIRTIWSLDEYKEGTTAIRGRVAPAVSEQLGELLGELHRMPVSGYGRLENSRTEIVGEQQSPRSGLASRFESPWPFCSQELDVHPAIRVQPALKKKLLPLKAELYAFVREGSPSLVHSDLHEGQLLVSDDSLSALLDFNDAMVGRSEWDLGSYLYFHGAECFDALLDGYPSSPSDNAHLKEAALLSSLLIALHHGNRGVVLNRPHRIQASARYLEQALS